MRTVRTALALLLALAVPLHAETTTDPLWYLLSAYLVTPDTTAVQADTNAPGDARGLAALQADLILLSEGFESFRDEGQVRESLARLEPRMSPELRPFFKDRASSLDAIYRTLSVTDYTWALRFPDPPCSPADARRRLLSGNDGLFQTEDGVASPWLVSLLGPWAKDVSADKALDQASSAIKMSAATYERRRANIRTLTLALASERATGNIRAKLYCLRAAAYEDLAAQHRLRDDGGTLASRSLLPASPERSVFVVIGKTRRAAATLLQTKSGPVLLTDASVVQDAGQVKLLAYSDDSNPEELTATVARRDDAIGLAVLNRVESTERPALTLSIEKVDPSEITIAIGHTAVSGPWTKTTGIMTHNGPTTFQTDAAISSEFVGGPVLNTAGEAIGVLVQRAADTEEGTWPIAVSAAEISRWLDDNTAVSTPASEPIEYGGTTAILSRARPDGLTETGLGAWNIPNLPPPPPTPRGVCVGNCTIPSSPSRSYSSNSRGSSYSGGSSYNQGNAELGKALGELGAVLILKGVPALFRGIGKLFQKKTAPKHALIDNRTRAVAPSAQNPKTPPEPLKPTSVTLSATPSIIAQGESLQAVATVGFSGKDGSRAGHSVSFTVIPGGKLSCPPASTDSAGVARTTCVALEDERDRRFDSLQDEVRRKMGMKTPGRVRRTAKSDKIAMLKAKEASAMEVLDGEEDRLSGFEPGGTDTPGIDKVIPETEVAELEIKGDRVTLNASIDKYQDQVALSVLERACPIGIDTERPTTGIGIYRCRNISPIPKLESYHSGDSAPSNENADGEPNEATGQTSPHGTTPQGRPYTHHYGEETGPGRKIPGSVVDSIIETIPPHRTADGKNVRYDPENEITVVTGRSGIISVHYGKPRKGQMQ